MSTILLHMVCLSANLECRSEIMKCAARGSLEIQNAKMAQKSPSAHHRTTSLGCIFAMKEHIDNRKIRVKQQYVIHMSSQYGEHRPTSG